MWGKYCHLLVENLVNFFGQSSLFSKIRGLWTGAKFNK